MIYKQERIRGYDMEELINKNIIASSHINFLFGAGVNGKAFPQLNGFEKSVNKMEEILSKKIDNFEDKKRTLMLFMIFLQMNLRIMKTN